jgi:hypothetical protein
MMAVRARRRRRSRLAVQVPCMQSSARKACTTACMTLS